MTNQSKLPDFVRLGARVRISYEGVVTEIDEGEFPYLILEVTGDAPGKFRTFSVGPPSHIPPTIELIEAAPNPQQFNSAAELMQRTDVLSVCDCRGHRWWRIHGKATTWYMNGGPGIHLHADDLPYPVTETRTAEE